MEFVYTVIDILAPYFWSVVFMMVLVHMVKGARSRRTAMIAFGILVQMFTPDPEIQTKAKMVMQAKESKGQKEQAEDADEPKTLR